MQLNLPTEGANGARSEQGSSSEDGQFFVASLKNMVKKEVQLMWHAVPQVIKPIMEELIQKKEFQLMLLNTLPQEIMPMIGDLVRNVVKEEIPAALEKYFAGDNSMVNKELHTLPQVIRSTMEDLVPNIVKDEIPAALEKFFTGGSRINTNAAAVSNERRLHLKFLDGEPNDVFTGKEIKGKGGSKMRVALVDEVTGNLVESGVESSAKVEILLLEASENDNEQNWKCQDFFNRRIIKESDRTKPHFPRSYHVCLEKGIGELTVKLAHDKYWKKKFQCRLGARVAENLNGIPVQETWTKPFEILDSRNKRYKKHHPPSLLDDVWRLVKIRKGGKPYKRLKEIKVSTVKDFRFLLSVDPQRLQNKIGPNVWKEIVDHALKCIVDDTRICMYNASSECNMSVVFDVVGSMKGVILDSNYVLIDDLPETEKICAHELLRSAFDNQDDITFYNDEKALMNQLPHQGSQALENLPSRRISGDLTLSKNIPYYDPTEPSTSSPSISPMIGPSGNANVTSNFGSLGLTTMASYNGNDISHSDSQGLTTIEQLKSYPIQSPDLVLHDLGSNFDISYLEFGYFSETLGDVPQSCQQKHAGSIHLFRVAQFILWSSRARKRVQSSGQGDVHISKKQKT